MQHLLNYTHYTLCQENTQGRTNEAKASHHVESKEHTRSYYHHMVQHKKAHIVSLEECFKQMKLKKNYIVMAMDKTLKNYMSYKISSENRGR